MAPSSNKYNLEEIMQAYVMDQVIKYKWFANLAEAHSISKTLFKNMIDFFDKVPKLKNEGEFLSLSLVLVNNRVKLENSFLKNGQFHISDLRKFSNLKTVVSGLSLCYLVNAHGDVTIKKIPKNMVKKTARLTMKLISEQFSTITLCVFNSMMFLYDSGRLIRIFRNNNWNNPLEMPDDVITKQGFPKQLLQKILELSYQLSEKNIGSTIVITKEKCVKQCKSLNKDCTIDKQPIGCISDDLLTSFANLDGAMIFNLNSELLKIGQRLESDAKQGDYEEEGRGTRHSSACKYSKSTASIVFVISHDGPISLYSDGKKIARCFDELFGKNETIE